jgi:hypothetical protein
VSFLALPAEFLLFTTIKIAAADEHHSTLCDLAGSRSASPGFAEAVLAVARL